MSGSLMYGEIVIRRTGIGSSTQAERDRGLDDTEDLAHPAGCQGRIRSPRGSRQHPARRSAR